MTTLDSITITQLTTLILKITIASGLVGLFLAALGLVAMLVIAGFAAL